jgi:small subunit ribosomal protein S3
MSAVKNVMKNNFRNLELGEYLATTLKDAGYGDVDVQKTPIGTRITLYVTRPGLVIGRKGTGIKDLTTRLEEKFGLTNPQVSVLEVSVPELNPNIMCNRIAQLIERGTAFRRAAMWSMNTIMNAGALGVEVAIAGKLRSERAHFEKHSAGVNPKSGDLADKIVRIGTTSVLTKMGLMGIQVRIALKNELPPEFELASESSTQDNSAQPQTAPAGFVNTDVSTTTPPVAGDVALRPAGKDGETVLAQGNTNGQS